jgi:hypothetical protein
MHHSTQNKDDEAKMLPGVPASSLPKPPLGIPVILVFSQRPAARISPADETSPIEGFEHIGEVSVRLVSEWSRPRMKLPSPREANDGSA